MAIKTFREYLRQYSIPSPHFGWDTKATGALVGVALLVIFGISFSSTPTFGIVNKLFMLLWVGCPFLWIYSDYCDTRDREERAEKGKMP